MKQKKNCEPRMPLCVRNFLLRRVTDPFFSGKMQKIVIVSKQMYQAKKSMWNCVQNNVKQRVFFLAL